MENLEIIEITVPKHRICKKVDAVLIDLIGKKKNIDNYVFKINHGGRISYYDGSEIWEVASTTFIKKLLNHKKITINVK